MPSTPSHLWWIFRDAFTCTIFAFTLNTAAYQAEIYRGAIRSMARVASRRRRARSAWDAWR